MAGRKPVRRVVVASAAGFDAAGRVFLVRRSRFVRTFRGYWQLPEGKLENGETPRAGIRRELREELAVRPRIGSLIAVVPSVGRSGGQLIRVLRCVYAVVLPTRYRLSAEHVDGAWFSVRRLRTLRTVPGTLAVVRAIRRALPGGYHGHLADRPLRRRQVLRRANRR